jgi:tRNA (guanine-N7-)-methyltransferase
LSATEHDTNGTDEAPGFPRRLVHSYGRRHGRKLRPSQSALIENHLDAYAVRTPLDLAATFGQVPARLRLEIGFGGGEHLAHQAATNPDIAFLGAEPFLNGVVAAVRHLRTRDLKNVRLYLGDARDLFPGIPDGALEALYVLHPDPWPKSRHHKRRLIQKPFLDEAARMLKPGGELRLATDDPPYLNWMLQRVLVHPDFEWTARVADDWRLIPEDAIETRYGIKSRLEGRPGTCLRLRRRETAA